jgi:hypothetical protein
MDPDVDRDALACPNRQRFLAEIYHSLVREENLVADQELRAETVCD